LKNEIVISTTSDIKMSDTTVKFIVGNQTFEFPTKYFQNSNVSDSMLGSLTNQNWDFDSTKPIKLENMDPDLFSIVAQYILDDCKYINIPEGVNIFEVHAFFNSLSLDAFTPPKNHDTIAQYIIDKKYETIAMGQLIMTDKKAAIERIDDPFHFDIINFDYMTGHVSIETDIKIDCECDLYCLTSVLNDEKIEIYIRCVDIEFNNILKLIDKNGNVIHSHTFDYYIDEMDDESENWTFILLANGDLFAHSSNGCQVIKYHEFDDIKKIEGFHKDYCKFEIEDGFGIWDPSTGKTICIEAEYIIMKIQGLDILIFGKNFIRGYRVNVDKFVIDVLWEITLFTRIPHSIKNLMFCMFDKKLPDILTEEIVLKEYLACAQLVYYGIVDFFHEKNFVSISFKEFEVLVRCINAPIFNNCIAELRNVKPITS